MKSEIFLKKDILKAEEKLFESGISVRSLIERAALALADCTCGAESVTVLSGGGKNGADGVCAAIVLADRGISVRIFTVGTVTSTECKELLIEAEDAGIEIRPYESGMMIYDEVVLDCIFGIGLSRDVQGIHKDAVWAINESGATVISADIPSGLNSDNGKIMGVCVKADKTCSFSGAKVGYFLEDGMDVTGEIIYADTGINPSGGEINLLQDVSFPKRKNNTHKGSYGKISIIAGCAKFVGAALLAERSACAALRSGAGLVKLCVPYSMKDVYASRVLESTLFYLPDTDGYVIYNQSVLNEIIQTSDVIAIGAGLGISDEVKKIVSYLVKNFKKPLILDADALNSISCEVEILKGGENIIVTPHLGEFARLTGKTIKEIDCLTDAANFAKEYGITVHLKGCGNVTADKNGKITVTASGTPAMAKGGSGDVLLGIAAAFYGQGIDGAMEKAAFVHGMSGRLAESHFGSYGTLARDIVDCIPQIISERIR